MTCRIGDFGLSVDLGVDAAEQEDSENKLYSGTLNTNKIPIRWTAIEVCRV